MAMPACREVKSKALLEAYGDKEAQLIALYGRRRVGKAYLIRELFQNRGIYFELIGKIYTVSR